MGVKNVARRCKKPRATKFITTGNEIYRNGQRNLSERATIFLPKSLCFFVKGEHIEFFFSQRIIYICACKKKKSISDSRAVPQKVFFFNEVGIKKLHSVRGLLDGEEGSERMKNEKGCLFERNSPWIVAEARLELTTFGLWAQRATTAPLRDVVAIILDCECKGRNSFWINKILAVFF